MRIDKSVAIRSVLLLVLLVLPIGAGAQAPPIVAVFDIEDRGSGMDPRVLENLTRYLTVRLAEEGYQVVPREQILTRLKEQKTDSYRDCYDEGCQIELGKEVSAQKSLSTHILKIASTCQVTATLYDLKKATTEKAASAEAPCNEEAMLGAIKKIVAKLSLTGSYREQEPAGVAKEAPAAYRRWNVDFKGALLLPVIGNVDVKPTSGSSFSAASEVGWLIELSADYAIWRYLSAGIYVLYAQTETSKSDEVTEVFRYNFFNAGLAFKGRFDLGIVELRPGIGGGYQRLTMDPTWNVEGFGLVAFLEASFPLFAGFGLVGEFGMIAQPENSGDDVSIGFDPILYLAVGLEYGG